MKIDYRKDIDGLRALAVISVILFHLGILKNGYLGVDVFFVISGYLITSIVYKEVELNVFSINRFYERRIRRIIPLLLFTSFCAFILGLMFMLPDDLENLCQSVFASNFSANNILMLITSSDYWAVKNDFKPLMHTWSLGIEEQFYLFYPLIFFFLKEKNIRYILYVLISLTVISLLFFLFSSDSSYKFYLLPYRFFELSIGGVCPILIKKNNLLNRQSNFYHYLLLTLLLLLCCILLSSVNVNNDLKILTVVIVTLGILVIGGFYYNRDTLYKSILTNDLIMGIGKISFSLYMWHQIVFSFYRYVFLDKSNVVHQIILILITVILSVLSYFFIEEKFRNRNFISTKRLMISVVLFFVFVTSSSFYVYAIGGVIRDVPELGIKKSSIETYNFFDKHNNINIQYNERIKEKDIAFTPSTNKRVLVIGDSFARDFVNILLESPFKNQLEVSYCDHESLDSRKSLQARISKADYVFIATNRNFSRKIYYDFYEKVYKIDLSKVWVVGIKDFGISNGFFYNQDPKSKSFQRTTRMKTGVLEMNNYMQDQWKSKYINLIDLVSDSEDKVLVYTPDNKFISQDTTHLTRFGAIYFSELLEESLKAIFFRE